MDSSNTTLYPESRNTSRDSGGNESTTSGIKATTIGSVVVRSGPLQLVIALLQSGDLYHIKVVEVEPKLTTLGENIDEAVSLQREHDELIKQLQNKRTPMEEFVQKADKLLAQRQSNPQVLDAMGHTLNIVWEDILKLIHDRKHLLDLCANFHEKMGSCRGKMSSLEVACKDTMIPIEIEAVQEFLNKFKQLRIDVLTAVMSALKDGNELLARLQDIAQVGTLDSRPDHIKWDAMRAINQVQQWLENLHDHRNMLETAWQTRKGQLEQCLALAILAKDLDDLENTLVKRRNDLANSFNLGECEHTASTTLEEYVGLKQDSLLLRDRSLKITRATEKLVSSGCFAGNEACSRAYNILSDCTEYFEQIDQREHWLHQSKDFFVKAEKTLTVLERLEIELSSIKFPTNSPEAFSLYAKILKDMKPFTEESLRLGYAILDEVGRNKSETQGVKRVLDEIENRKVYIEGICSASTEEQVKVTQAITHFMEQYNEILTWLVSIAEAFLRSTNSMGTSISPAKNFLHLHHKLMQDLEIKGENINELLQIIKPFLESLDAQQRYEVDTKAESLHKHWIELKDIVIKRVDLVSIYIEFLEKAESLSELFNHLEQNLRQTPEQEKLQKLETVWNDLRAAYGNLKAVGIRFLNIKVADPYLETKTACATVEEILNRFSNRQFDITTSWENWTTNIIEKRETEILFEKIMNENIEILNQATKLDAQLYPILTSTSNDPRLLKDHIHSKLETVLEDIDHAQNEILQRLETTSNVQTKDQDISHKIDQVLINLRSIKTKLDNIKYDYRTLIENIINFLTNLIDIRQLIENYFQQKSIESIETIGIDREHVERNLNEHEQFRETIMSKFRAIITQSEKIIDNIRALEPQGAREQDTEKILSLLENLRIYFESNNEERMNELQKLQLIKNFERDLNDINNNLDNVSKQLNDIREQYAETSASAKTTSLAFEYFERTIELLEKRIENFIKTSENIYTKYPDTENYIKIELNHLKNKWENFKTLVKSTRQTLNLTNDYFALLELIETEYREINTFYMQIVNKIPYIRQPVEASNLINDIEKYVGDHEDNQMKKLKKLSLLSYEIYGNDRTTTIYRDNMSLLQSFIKLKSDISIVEERLRHEINLKEQQTQQMQQQKQTIDEIDQKFIQIHKNQVKNEILTEVKYTPPKFIKFLKSEQCKEGDKYTFECDVIGDPEPKIEWFKDGISIQNNSDYHTKYENGKCSLTIEETFTADSALFMCRASNLVDTAETAASLSVKEHSTDMTPPKILKYLENGKAREGSSFQFSCTVSGKPLPTVQWFKHDRCIDDSPDYVITYNNGEALLKFEEAFLEDQAVYTCKVSNPIGYDQCSASLTVEPLEPTEVPLFKVPLSNVMARVGQKLKLECIVTGIPRPEIYWMHNGKPFGGRDIKYENDRVTLIIPEAYPKDSGVYVVTAKNLAGEAYSSSNVSVKGRLPNETSDSEFASDMEPIKPSVQLPLKDVSIFEGKSVRFDCVIIGQPEPEVIWYHKERPVKESPDVQLYFQGDRCSLVIQEAYLEDAGQYKVVALNSAGEASSSCNLTVTPLNIAEPATRTQTERIVSNESPPKFEKFLSDVLAAEGDTVELECSVIGDPKPIIKWYLSNKEIFENNRIQFVTEKDGVFKLIIKNVTADDKGVYTAKASNTAGDAKCFSHLIVKSINISENQRTQQIEIEEKLICPTFKELFSDKNVHQDEVVKFECIVHGKPTPKVKWFFNDQPIHGKNFLISTSGDRQVLTIPSACPDTVGKIACVAENDIGKATCVAHLNLIGDGIQQPSSTMDVQSMSQEHNTESSRVTIKKQTFTTTSTSQINSVENNLIPQIHSKTSHLDHSFKQFGQQPAEIVETRHYQEYHNSQNTDTPSSIQQKTIIINTKPEEIESHFKMARKQIAPRFVSPLVGKIVDQGANVVLEATYDGHPTPDIKIQKNGEDLIESDHVKIVNKFNNVSIDLSNVGIRDAGRYSITASNASGTSTSTADVVVKKTIFPPVFGHRLQAQVAKRGERVVMDVEVTGTPDPTVTWYKDNKPLKEIMTSEYKVKTDGNSHTLIIEKVKIQDSGKYMVKATNAGGEAQSIADFAVLEPTPERMVEVVKTVVYDDLKDFKGETLKPQSKSFHSEKFESKTESDLRGLTESKIITEHRCTTQATMRMEHKASLLDFPVLRTAPAKHGAELSEMEQKTVSTNTDIDITKTNATQTPPQILPKPSTVPMSENSSIESTSISKKSAYEFFKNIQSEPVTSIPVTSSNDKYTKFDDLNKSTIHERINLGEDLTKSILNDSVQLQKDLIKLNLTPGSPPEIGFVPKHETIPRENIADRIKKLEESQRTDIEAPTGGVQVLPQISRKEEYSTSFMKETKYETSSGPIFRPQATLQTPPASFERAQSPKPSADGVAMEKLWASPKPFEHESFYKETEQEHKKFASTSESEPAYPLPQEPVRSQTIKETTKIFEEKIKEVEPTKWTPPTIASDLKAPFLVKQLTPQPEKPKPEKLIDIHLEPGPPPEICFAAKPTVEPQPSFVETIEQSLETDLLKEPSKVLPGTVRTMPPMKMEAAPPLPPKDFQISAPPLPSKSTSFMEKSVHSYIYAPPTQQVPKTIPASSFIPPKFIKSEFHESDYENEKWKCSGSESDEQAYRSVKPPQFIAPNKPKLTEYTPAPPSQFDTPITFTEPIKPKSSGYTADTEESVFRKYESRSVRETKQLYESQSSTQQQQYMPQSFPTNQYRQQFQSNVHRADFIPPEHKPYTPTSMVKNISMTTKQVRENVEPQLEPFPFKPDLQKPKSVKVPPPPSPSKFIKGEFRESDYGSDHDEKIQPIWKPYDSDSEVKSYRPIHPILTPTGRRSNISDITISPLPPSEFDQPPRFEGPPRPKFEPIKHEQPIKVQPQTHVYKPKPVSAKYVTPPSQQIPPRQEYTTRYYTAIAGTPFHNASLATETRNSMQMKESSESCRRVVNMSQTKRVIQFDNEKSNFERKLEPFPYTPSPTNTASPRPRIQAPPTPTKFIRGEFRESDYDAELENARIRPVWSPNWTDYNDPRYRHVNPPRPGRSTSLPRSYERIVTPMEFDTATPEMPSKIPLESPTQFYKNQAYQSRTMDRHSSSHSTTQTMRTTRDDMNLKVGSPPKYSYIGNVAHQQAKDIGSAFRQKTNQYVDQISKDMKTTTHAFRPGFKRAPSEGDNKPQMYRDESRVSQYGTKHIDPNTGLIYFKYDFGYEFGILFPGQGKKLIGGMSNSQNEIPSNKKYPSKLAGYGGDIVIPVHHERSTPNSFKQNGFTSESEFSETEYDSHAKKRYSLPIDINIDELHRNDKKYVNGYSVTDYSTNTPINANSNRDERPKRPPIFITPLKDIAVVIGQTARFECIVQCEPHPQIVWSKNGFPLQHSNKHFIEFRNGVCRLTIPEAYPDDAATYSCTGTNQLGSVTTSAELLVPANRCGVRY